MLNMQNPALDDFYADQYEDYLEEIRDRNKPTTKKDRTNCTHRHENGNCLPIGGFCLAVDDKHCKL